MNKEASWKIIQCRDSLSEIKDGQVLVDSAMERLNSLYSVIGKDGKEFLGDAIYLLSLYRDLAVRQSLRKIDDELENIRSLA